MLKCETALMVRCEKLGSTLQAGTSSDGSAAPCLWASTGKIWWLAGMMISSVPALQELCT